MTDGRLLLFGGTTEARELLERGLPALYCVATEYGAELVRALPNVEIRIGRLDSHAMEELIRAEKITCVLDATHPYATEVSANIKQACTVTKTPLLRVLRSLAVPESEDVIRVDSCETAATWLNENYNGDNTSHVLLTVGTKELPAFTSVNNYQERLIARVLPTEESLHICTGLGFNPSHVIAMRGPFSREMNIATLRDTRSSVLVTKDSGTSGGTQDKIAAAREVGAKVILITRPVDSGVSVTEALLWARRHLGLERPPLFPLMIDLEGKLALVVGGGKIAGRRAATFLKCGAHVRAVSPTFREDFPGVDSSFNVKGRIEYVKRPFKLEDLDGVTLVTAATDDREVNNMVGREARRRGIPVSIADAAAEGDYFFPSLVTSGATAVSVSSAGLSPSITRRLSDKLRAVWDEWVAEVSCSEPESSKN